MGNLYAALVQRVGSVQAACMQHCSVESTKSACSRTSVFTLLLQIVSQLWGLTDLTFIILGILKSVYGNIPILKLNVHMWVASAGYFRNIQCV